MLLTPQALAEGRASTEETLAVYHGLANFGWQEWDPRLGGWMAVPPARTASDERPALRPDGTDGSVLRHSVLEKLADGDETPRDGRGIFACWVGMM